MGATKVDLDDRYRTTTDETSEEEPRSQQIKEEIDLTRDEMDQTLNELGDRLNPRNLLEQMLDIFRSPTGATARETGETLRQAGRRVAVQVRRHPVPSLLFTAGLAWMIFAEDESEERRHREPLGWDSGPPPTTEHAGHFVDARTGEPYDESYGQEYWEEQARQKQEGESSWSESARQAGASLSQSASEAAHRVRQASDRAREGASQLGEKADYYRHQAQDRAREFGHQMQQGMASSRESLSRAMHEYPLASGAAAAALGLLAGLLLPRTRTEDELMGEPSERVKEQARSTAQEAYERGKDVAQATASTIAEEAERQGLMPDQLAEKASQIASTAQESVKDSAEEEGLSPDTLQEKAQHVAEEAKQTAQHEAERQQEEMAR